MDESTLTCLITCAAVGVLCIAAMIREVLLKKERDKWRELFERRNRKEDWER